MKRREKITPEQFSKVEEWHRARKAIGTQKALAHKVGISEAQFKMAVMRIKRETCNA